MAAIKSRADGAPSDNGYYPIPATGWRSRVRDYTPLIGEENQEKLDAVRDVVYGMALQGANEKDIVEYFGWDPALVRQQVGPVIKMAQAELRLLLKHDQITSALASKLPLMKIWAGKQFADQRDDVALTSAADGEGTGLLVTVVRANRDQHTGQTLGEASSEVVSAGT